MPEPSHTDGPASMRDPSYVATVVGVLATRPR